MEMHIVIDVEETMNRIIIFFLCLNCVFGSAISSKYEDQKNTFVVNEEQQEIIYNTIINNSDNELKSVITIDHMSIVKESIIPMYIMDVYSYAETGVLKIYPEVYELNNSEINVFQVDLMTDDGKYGGVIQFYIKDGKAYHLLEIPSHHKLMKEGTEPANKNYEIINGYFTNVENVKKVLKIENISDRDEKDIRYVTVEELREKYFCVDCGNRLLMVSPARIDKNGDLMQPYYFYDDEAFLQRAKEALTEYKEGQIFYEEWTKEHPGELYTYVGGPGAVISNNDNELTTIPSKEKSKWLIVLLLIVCISIIMMAGYIIIKKKKNLKTIDQT